MTRQLLGYPQSFAFLFGEWIRVRMCTVSAHRHWCMAYTRTDSARTHVEPSQVRTAFYADELSRYLP